MRGCEAVVVELPGYVGGKLDAPAALSVQRHLQACGDCQSELREIERLEQLLSVALPAVKPSPGFASSFANRLAQEVLDEAQEARATPRSFLSWLTQPWLLPVGAAAVIALIMANMYGPWFGSEQSTVWPAHAPSVASNERKPAPDSKLAAKPAEKAEKKTLAAASPPPADLIARPDLFVDYAVINDLDQLEPDKAG